MTVTEITPLDKRRSKVILDEDFALALYNGEIKRYHIETGEELPEETYREIMEEILLKRAVDVYKRQLLWQDFPVSSR